MKDNRRKAGSKATCFPVSLLVLRGIHSALDPYQGLCTGDGGPTCSGLIILYFNNKPTSSPLAIKGAPLHKSKTHTIYQTFIFLEI